jgi:hypothetical protein
VTPSEERRIEKLIRRPEAMAEEERLRARRLVEEDPGAAQYASFLEGFYDRLEEERERPSDPRMDEFVDELFGPGAPGSQEEAPVIPVEPRDPGPQVRPTVLAVDAPAPAAASDKEASPQSSSFQGGSLEESPEEKRFVLLASLRSEEEKVLVRVLRDRKTDQGRLYVLPGPGEKSRDAEPHALVSFPEFGRDILTGEDGRASFELPPRGDRASSGPGLSETGPLETGPLEEWSGAHAVVRRPVAAEELPPEETVVLSPSSTEEPEGRLLCRREGGQLAVTIEGEAARAFLTVSPPEGEPALLSLRPGRPSPKDVPPEEPVALRLYR